MIRHIRQYDILKCPFAILMIDHYRDDGTCRCDDPTHTEMEEEGYKWNTELNHWDVDDES